MMRIDSFARGVAFAALAAAAWLPWAVIGVPILGLWNARAVYLVVTAVTYVASLPATRRSSSAVVVGTVGVAVAVAVQTTAELVIILAALVGAVRGISLPQRRAVRALAVEVLLLGGGLLAARALSPVPMSPVPLSPTAFGVWGFFLVQSLYFLRTESVRARSMYGTRDEFEEACRRASDLLNHRAVDVRG